jgi:hypothetical protein
MRRASAGALAAVVTVALLYRLVLTARLPGDELLEDGDDVATRAIGFDFGGNAMRFARVEPERVLATPGACSPCWPSATRRPRHRSALLHLQGRIPRLEAARPTHDLRTPARADEELVGRRRGEEGEGAATGRIWPRQSPPRWPPAPPSRRQRWRSRSPCCACRRPRRSSHSSRCSGTRRPCGIEAARRVLEPASYGESLPLAVLARPPAMVA